MNFRRFIVFYRLPLAAALLALGLLLGFKGLAGGWWTAWIPILVGLVFIFAHFFIGPMTLIQGYIESGDMEGAQKMLDRVKFPNLLYKPIRSTYYMLRGNLSSMNRNLDQAEADIRKGLEAGLPEKEFEGSAYLQLASISLQKGNTKEAYDQLKKAVAKGLPDANNKAAAYMYLTQIEAQRRNFRAAKMMFAKAKAAKPNDKQIVDQIKQIEKDIARMPG